VFLVSAGATARSEPETKRSDRGESAGGRRPHGSALSPCRTRGQNQRPACQLRCATAELDRACLVRQQDAPSGEHPAEEGVAARGLRARRRVFSGIGLILGGRHGARRCRLEDGP